MSSFILNPQSLVPSRRVPNPQSPIPNPPMTAVILEWLNALLSWAHIMTGIAWIGTSFFYIWMEAAIKKRAGQAPGIAGDVWMVHGGGFWVASKYAVAPDEIPEELHWFKWEAYFTLVTGLLLSDGDLLFRRRRLPDRQGQGAARSALGVAAFGRIARRRLVHL